MRELRFKGWLVGIGKMTYSHSLDELMNWNTKPEDNGTAIWLQYTGLKDKNGVEIYEGDIISFAEFDYNGSDSQYVGVIKFDCCEFRIWRTNDDEFWGSDGAFMLFGIHQQDDELEVVGNIYENPDLLPKAIVSTESA